MIVDSLIRVRFDELSPSQCKKLERELTFTTESGEIVTSYVKRYTRNDYLLPRGAWFLLPDSIRYEDKRTAPKISKMIFTVKLDDVKLDERFVGQSQAVAQMFEQEQGLIVRPPGTGKTQIALAFAAKCQTRTLVIVHTEDILNQWMQYAKVAVPDATIGIVRGKKVIIGDITIATVQTLFRMISNRDSKWWKQFGCVIADEAHHVSAPTWEAVLNMFPARYRFGFTASPTRADGLERTMRYIVGPVIHRQSFSSPVDLKVVPVRTKFTFRYRGHFDWQPLLNSLTTDKKRNRQIARGVVRECEKGNSILVLSRRIEQLELIAGQIEKLSGAKTEILHSKRGKERQRIIDELRQGSLQIVLATQLADEALDVQRLNRVFLVHPGKAEGRLVQQVGRAIREHDDKRDARIFDYVDWNVRVLRKQWHERVRVYKKNKISIRIRKARV